MIICERDPLEDVIKSVVIGAVAAVVVKLIV